MIAAERQQEGAATSRIFAACALDRRRASSGGCRSRAGSRHSRSTARSANRSRSNGYCGSLSKIAEARRIACGPKRAPGRLDTAASNGMPQTDRIDALERPWCTPPHEGQRAGIGRIGRRAAQCAGGEGVSMDLDGIGAARTVSAPADLEHAGERWQRLRFAQCPLQIGGTSVVDAANRKAGPKRPPFAIAKRTADQRFENWNERRALALAVLLALDDAAVAGQEAALLEHGRAGPARSR